MQIAKSFLSIDIANSIRLLRVQAGFPMKDGVRIGEAVPPPSWSLSSSSKPEIRAQTPPRDKTAEKIMAIKSDSKVKIENFGDPTWFFCNVRANRGLYFWLRSD